WPVPPHQHQPESFLHQQQFEPMPSYQQFRPIQDQGQYTIPLTDQYSMLDSQPRYQGQQSISDPSYPVEQEQINFVTSHESICDHDSFDSLLARFGMEVDRPPQSHISYGWNQEKPTVSDHEPLVLIYPEDPIQTDCQIISQSPPGTYTESEPRPLQL